MEKKALSATTHVRQNDLLPCPFCGNEPFISLMLVSPKLVWCKNPVCPIYWVALIAPRWNQREVSSVSDGTATGAPQVTPKPSASLQAIAREAAWDIANCYATSYASVQGNAGCWGEKHVPELQSIILAALTKALTNYIGEVAIQDVLAQAAQQEALEKKEA